MQRRGLFRGSINTTPNTFIGGVASTIPDSATLANKLTTTERPVTASDIVNFTINGNDISCRVKVDYTMKYQAFASDSNITYYRDNVDGKCKKLETAFWTCANLTEIDLISAQPTAEIGRSSGLLNTIKLTGATSIPNDFLKNCSPDTLIDIRNATLIGASNSVENNCFQSNGSADLYVHASLETINGGATEPDIATARDVKNYNVIFV
jgi:hypothetical protein